MNILVALSDKYFADAILDFMKHRRWQEGMVQVLHVLDSQSSEIKNEPVAPHYERYRQQMKMLEDFECALSLCHPRLDIEKSVITGKPADVILRTAEKWPADLIIMGAHGLEGLERLLLGSVSMAVTAKSPCSVVIVKPLQSTKLDVCLCEEEDMPQQLSSINLECCAAGTKERSGKELKMEN